MEQLGFYNVMGTEWHHQIAGHESGKVDLFMGVRTKQDGTARGFYMVRTFLMDKAVSDRKFTNVKNAIKYYNIKARKAEKEPKIRKGIIGGMEQAGENIK